MLQFLLHWINFTKKEKIQIGASLPRHFGQKFWEFYLRCTKCVEDKSRLTIFCFVNTHLGVHNYNNQNLMNEKNFGSCLNRQSKSKSHANLRKVHLSRLTQKIGFAFKERTLLKFYLTEFCKKEQIYLWWKM